MLVELHHGGPLTSLSRGPGKQQAWTSLSAYLQVISSVAHVEFLLRSYSCKVTHAELHVPQHLPFDPLLSPTTRGLHILSTSMQMQAADAIVPLPSELMLPVETGDKNDLFELFR